MMRFATAAFALPFLALVATQAACTADTTDDDPDGDPVLDGKSDGASPILKGTLGWTGSQDVAFTDDSGDSTKLVYLTFSLSGDADIVVDTQAPMSNGSSSLDTVLYIYQPTGDNWNAYLYRNDNGGAGKYSQVSAHLGAGDYRVLIRRKTGTGTPNVGVAATCSGTGCAPAVEMGCTALSPRTVDPEIFIGPDNWESNIEAQIDAATTSLDVQMYLFTVTDIAQHIITAATVRHVAVRVLTDNSEGPNNAAVIALLNGAHIPNHIDPTIFSFAHAKYMIVDKKTAVILSGNFNVGAVTTTGGGERNYGIIDRDPQDVADLQKVYESDWAAGPEPDLSCTRLIVSPINSKQRVLDHVNAAMDTLDIEVLYLDDTDVRAAIVDAAQTRHVAVRIMLSDPAKNPQNTATQTYFAGLGIPTKFLLTNYLHAKMLQSDGVAQVASENMSETSLTKNREVGELIFEPTPAGEIHDQYEADWSNAVDSPN